MPRSMKLFGWVAGLGTLPYLVFGMVAVFQPDLLSAMLGLEWVEFSYVWIANLGMLALVWVLLSFPVAGAPERYRYFAWALTLTHLLMATYWGVVVLKPDQRVFSAFFWVEAVLFVAQAVLLARGPAEIRPTLANFRDEMLHLVEAHRGENRWWTWFRRVTWLGIGTNLVLFCIPALVAQGVIARQVGLGITAFSPVPLAALGVFLAALTVAYVPAAVGPSRYAVYPWLIAFNRLAMGIFWFNVYRTPYQEGFLTNFLSDFGYGVVLLGLLAMAYRADKHPVWVALTDVRPMAASVATVLGVVVLSGLAVASQPRPLGLPNVQANSMLDHYQYDAIGLSVTSRVPYDLWRVLPTMFPEYLPDPDQGAESLGLLYEKGKDVPVGMALRTDGPYPTLEPNCALCHTGSYRASPDSERVLLPGAPAGMLDLQGFQRFLYAAASDPRFTPENVVREIAKVKKLSFGERVMYKYAVIPMTKTGLLMQKEAYAWQHTRPPQGRGRTDTFNPTKINVFHLPDDGSIGTTDLPQIWNQGIRDSLHMWLHWDGNNNSLRERNLAAAMAVGATPRSVILPSFQRVFDFARTLQPPAYPFPIDQAKAARGKTIFEASCQSCHAFDGDRVGKVTNIQEVKTDPHRLNSFTQELVDRFHLVEEFPFKFDAYRKTQGYANMPIDGIWARAPYLHHGAVPTLWDLLQPPEKRPAVFYRGYDVYDPVKVGFVSSGPDAEREGWRYDTSVRGNSREGHLYGTTLSDEEKWALVEYLKTF